MRGTFFTFAIGLMAAGAASTAWGAEKLIARSGRLAAYMEQGACAEEIAITVRAPGAAAFEGGKVELQKLLGGIKAIMGLQCPAAERFAVTGEVNGETVYAGLVDHAAGGMLVDREVAAAETSGAPQGAGAPMVAPALPGAAPSAAPPEAAGEEPAPAPSPSRDYGPLAREYGLHLARGLPVLAGAGGALTQEQGEAASKFLDFVELSLDPGLIEANPDCWAETHLPKDVSGKYFVTGAEGDWKGANEFEKERTKQSFLKDHAAGLKARAVSLPLEALVIDEMTLPQYNAEAGGFDLRFKDINQRGASFDTFATHRNVSHPAPTCAGREFAFSPAAVTLPEVWAMDAARAEEIVKRLNERKAYIAFTLRFHPMPNAKMEDPYRPSDRVPVWSESVSVGIYEDADLERPIEMLPLRTAEKPVLLTGVPERARFAEAATVNEETLALAMLRDHGDVFSDEAWRLLMVHQAGADQAYYRRKRDRDVGHAVYSGETDDYDKSYIPFFPNGFSASHRTEFPEGMVALFKQWAKLRAENLPGELIFRTQIFKHGDKPAEMRLPVAEKRDSTGFVATLAAEGYSVNQILRPDVNPTGVGARFNDGYLAGPNVARKPALVLPNIVTSYIPSFTDADVRQIFEGGRGSRLAEILVEAGPSKLVSIDESSAAFVLHGAPTRLRTYNPDGSAVLFEHRYEVAALDPDRLDVESPPVQPPSGEALPLSAEAMDLLMVKHLPRALSDEDFRQMMMARWVYEASVPPDQGEPDWGRFFVPGKPKPDEGEQADILPRFRVWTQKRAAALPKKIRLYLDSARVKDGEPISVFASGIYSLGGLDGNAIHSRMLSCTSSARSHPALAPACDYLKNVQDNTPAAYPFGLGHQMAGPRLRCRSALGSGRKEVYCDARQAQFEKVGGTKAEPGFREILIFDKEIFFPGGQAEAASLGSSVSMMVDVAVTGARVADEPLPVPFVEAFDRYEAFSEALGLQGSGRRTGDTDAAVSTFFVFDAEVLSARLAKQKTGEPLKELELRPARTPDLDALALPDTAAQVPDQPFGPEVAGVRLGMTFEAAERAIRSHMRVGRVLVRERGRDLQSAAGNFEKLSSSRLYVAEDNSELIILYDEPPAARDVVIGVTRQVSYAKGQTTAAAALAGMRKTYGREDWTGRSGGIGWGEGLAQTTIHDMGAHQCLPSTGNRSARDWMEVDGTPTQWTPGSGRGVPNLQLHTDVRGRICGPVMSMEYDAVNRPQAADRLVLQLIDPTLYGRLYEESKRLIRSGEAAFEPAAAPSGTGVPSSAALAPETAPPSDLRTAASSEPPARPEPVLGDGDGGSGWTLIVLLAAAGGGFAFAWVRVPAFREAMLGLVQRGKALLNKPQGK